MEAVCTQRSSLNPASANTTTTAVAAWHILSKGQMLGNKAVIASDKYNFLKTHLILFVSSSWTKLPWYQRSCRQKDSNVQCIARVGKDC